MRRALAFLLAVATLGQCAPVAFDRMKPGKFTGSLFVMWVGEGDALGDGKFVFVPNPVDPLTFTRSAADATVTVIRPGMMYTDGGSIPKVVQVFKGFGPWGYAPAYMVHDWVFVARHCIRDGLASDEQKLMDPITFPESADIMGEAIRTLIEARRVMRNDVAGGAITSVVAGPISRAIWERNGQCKDQEVTPEHRAEVERNFPGRSRAALRRILGAPEPLDVPTGGPKARILAEVSF